MTDSSFQPAAGGITAATFPTPATAITTNDTSAIATVYGFAHAQAATARSIVTTLKHHRRAWHPVHASTNTVIATLLAASTWRHRYATILSASKQTDLDRWYRSPFSGEKYTRIGYVGRVRENSVWDAATQLYLGGLATPAYHALVTFGEHATDRFALEAPSHDTLQNQVWTSDGTVLLGNRLLRRAAVLDVAARIGRSATTLGRTGEVELGGNPIYTVTGPRRLRDQIHRGAVTALATALDASAEHDADTAIRLWALGAYLLYQAPQTARGTDAATRIALVVLGTFALGRVPHLPHDIDLRAQVFMQHHFVDQLIVTSRQPAGEMILTARHER